MTRRLLIFVRLIRILAPAANGIVCMLLISLKVIIFDFVFVAFENTVRQYFSNSPISSRLSQPLYFCTKA